MAAGSAPAEAALCALDTVIADACKDRLWFEKSFGVGLLSGVVGYLLTKGVEKATLWISSKLRGRYGDAVEREAAPERYLLVLAEELGVMLGKLCKGGLHGEERGQDLEEFKRKKEEFDDAFKRLFKAGLDDGAQKRLLEELKDLRGEISGLKSEVSGLSEVSGQDAEELKRLIKDLFVNTKFMIPKPLPEILPEILPEVETGEGTPMA